MPKTKLSQISLTFLKIGIFSFGAATTEVIIENIVERKKLLTLDKVRDGIAIAGLSPGPFHINLVLHLGYRLRGVKGMMVALFSFIIPSIIVGIILSLLLLNEEIFSMLNDNPGIVRGVIATIAGILANAIIKLSVGQLKYWAENIIVLICLVSIVVLNLPFIAIILSGALLYLFYRTKLKNSTT